MAIKETEGYLFFKLHAGAEHLKGKIVEGELNRELFHTKSVKRFIFTGITHIKNILHLLYFSISVYDHPIHSKYPA